MDTLLWNMRDEQGFEAIVKYAYVSAAEDAEVPLEHHSIPIKEDFVDQLVKVCTWSSEDESFFPGAKKHLRRPSPRNKAKGRNTDTSHRAAQRARKTGVQSLDQIDDEELAKIYGITKVAVGRSRSTSDESSDSSTSSASFRDV